MDFGLGLVLSFTDNATAGINNAVNTLNQLTATAESASNSLNEMASLSALSVVSGKLGSSLTNLGSSILGMFQNVVGGIQNTGTEFQSLRITLNAMLKDEQKAEESLNKLINFAATTPFEITDLTGIFTTITANGLDAFKTLQGATTGYQESLLAAIGDLMAFRPDVPAQQWGIAIRNAFSGEVRSLKNALDINVNDMLGRKWGASGDIAQDFIDLADAIGVAGMMQQNFDNNMKVQMANMEDQITKIKLAIADTGVFDLLIEAVGNIAGALGRIDGDRLTALAESLGSALQFLLKPVVKLSKMMGGLIDKLVDFIGNHSGLVKIIAVLTALSGVLLIVAGVALKFMSALSGLSLLVLASGKSFKQMGSLLQIAKTKILGALLPLTATLGLMYIVWKSNFLGIRTLVTEFANNIKSSFDTARYAVNGSVEELTMTLVRLRNQGDFFSNLTIGIMKVKMTFEALADAWNDYELSEDNLMKAKELGILPLIEAILDLKYSFGLFKEGFIAGWEELSTEIVTLIEGISVSVKGTVFESLFDSITSFFQLLSSGDAESWRKFGENTAYVLSALMIAVPLIKVIEKAISIVSKLGGIISKVAGGIKTVVEFLMNNPIVMIITGIITAVTSFVDMFKKGFSVVKEIIMVVGIALTTLGAILLGVAAFPAVVAGAIVAALATVVILVKDNWQKIKDFFKSIADWCVNIFNTVISKVKGLFSSLSSFFKGVWNNIISLFKSVGTTVGNAISSAVKSAINYVLSGAVKLINGFISALNFAIGIINKIPGVEINKITPLDVPQLATGGVVEKPTLSVIGEEGKEAVVPLENNIGWITKLATMISSQIEGIRPTNSSVTTTNQGDSNNQRYLTTTNNNTTQTIQGDTDNSIVFNEGAIQLNVQNATEEEAIRMAKIILEYIKRQRQLDKMLSYA